MVTIPMIAIPIEHSGATGLGLVLWLDRQTDGHMDRHLSTAQSVVQAYGAGMLSPNSNHRNSERQISDTRPKYTHMSNYT